LSLSNSTAEGQLRVNQTKNEIFPQTNNKVAQIVHFFFFHPDEVRDIRKLLNYFQASPQEKLQALEQIEKAWRKWKADYFPASLR
jgi:hypothetical protein